MLKVINFFPVKENFHKCNIMAKGFRFIYPAFGLVRLRTFRLAHWLVRCKVERRSWRARGEDVSFRDVKIKIPDRKFDQDMWMTSCTGSARGGSWGFWKKWVEFCLGRRRLTFACSPWPCVGCARGLGQMEKSGVSLSLCRRTFKLKGNKKFRTWTKKS